MDDIGTLKENGVNLFTTKVEWLSNKYSTSNNVYFSVVPSKSYFVNDNLKTPFDYNKMFDILKGIKSAEYIDITNKLTLRDYYITDPHWKQNNLKNVVDALGKNMGFSVSFSSFNENKIEGFTGQHGVNKENFIKEDIFYLTSTTVDNALVSHAEGTAFNKVYDLEKLNSSSPYDVFLSGPSAITTIKNENAASDKALVIFGDSYSRNLAPLLLEAYAEITLIDLRYVISSFLDNYVTFENKDILFIYNEQIINNGEMLKVIMK